MNRLRILHLKEITSGYEKYWFIILLTKVYNNQFACARTRKSVKFVRRML